MILPESIQISPQDPGTMFSRAAYLLQNYCAFLIFNFETEQKKKKINLWAVW